jgi:Ca-activated chloride channel family protein
MLPMNPAEAFEWSELWSRPDQRASHLFETGDAAGAADLFDDPAWKGAAAHRAGRYDASLAALEGLDDIEATYNRGNSLARLGRYDEAIEMYNDILERDPDHRDARYNRDLLLEQQQQNSDGESDQESGERQNSADRSQEQSDQQSAGGQDPTDDEMSQANADQNNAPAGQQNKSAEQNPPADNQSSAGAEQETDPTMQESGHQPDDESQDPQATALSDNAMSDEDALATEQWLRKIPDDPGGLLRRKFLYQYQRQHRGRQEDEQW